MSAPPVAGPDAERPSRFTGRRRELEILVRHLDALWRSPAESPPSVRAGGSVVMLVGESGIGKTRLARRFAEIAESRGALVLWGTAIGEDAGPAHGPWSEMLSGLATRTRPDALVEDLGAGAPAVARAVPDVRRILPAIPPATPLDPTDERLRLWEAVARWLRRAAEHSPVVIVLDDIDVADEDTTRLLRYVARNTVRDPILIVGAYRQPPRKTPATGETTLARMLGQLRLERPYRRLALQGFGSEDVARLLGDRVRIRLGRVAVERLTRRTGGNPFFVEVARRLVLDASGDDDDGEDETDTGGGGAAAAGAAAQAPLPAWPIVGRGPDRAPAGTLPTGGPNPLSGLKRREELLDRRIARRSPNAATVLRILATLPGTADRGLLTPISELAPAALLQALDELVRAGLVIGDDSGPLPAWRVAHPIVRDAFEGRWPVARRAHLHRRVAQALERLAAGREREAAPTLGWHYHASAAVPGAERGVRYLLLASEAARGAYAFVRAARLMGMAVAAARPDDRAGYADLVGRHALAQADAALPEAIATVEVAARAMADVRLPAPTMVTVLADVAWSIRAGDAVAREVVRPLLERGLTLLRGDRGRDWARLKLLGDAVVPLAEGPRLYAGRWPGHDRQAVAVLLASTFEDDRAETIHPHDVRSRAETDALLVAARSWRRPAAAMRATLAGVRDLVERHGAFREGSVAAAQLVGEARAHGAIRIGGAALLELSLAQFALGDVARAVTSQAAAQRRLTGVAPTPELTAAALSVRLVQAYYLDLGWHDLERTLARGLRDPARATDPDAQRFAAWAALGALRIGRPEVATERLDAVVDLLSETDPGVSAHAATVIVAGVVAWELGAGQHAATLHALAEDLLATGTATHAVGSARLTIGRMTVLLGDPREAVQQLARERAAFVAWGLEPLAAIATHDGGIAMWSAATDIPTTDAVLRQAASRFSGLGMTGWARRATDQSMALTAGIRTALREAQLTFPDGLTAREVDILRLHAAGAGTQDIAARLFIEPAAVRRHLTNAMAKAGVSDRQELRDYALRRGLVPPS